MFWAPCSRPHPVGTGQFMLSKSVVPWISVVLFPELHGGVITFISHGKQGSEQDWLDRDDLETTGRRFSTCEPNLFVFFLFNKAQRFSKFFRCLTFLWGESCYPAIPCNVGSSQAWKRDKRMNWESRIPNQQEGDQRGQFPQFFHVVQLHPGITFLPFPGK